MKIFSAFIIGVIGCAFLNNPGNILEIERVSVGIERSPETKETIKKESKIQSEKIHKKKKNLSKWREQQDEATERLLNNN